MRSVFTVLGLCLFGLSIASADKAVTTTRIVDGVKATDKTWTLKNGTKISHSTVYAKDGKVATWERVVHSKNGEAFRGRSIGVTYAGRSGMLGNAKITQTVTSSSMGPRRTVEIENSDGRASYDLLQTRYRTMVTKTPAAR